MWLLDRLLPPRCLLCDDPGVHGMPLCAGCLGECTRNDPACSRCAEALPGTADTLPDLTVCGACLWRPPPYTAIHAPYRYAAPLDGLIHRLKFRGDLAAGRLLGLMLARAAGDRFRECNAIVPIPLHPRRLRTRGYNQAVELARPLARHLGIPIRPDALVRGGSTRAQMELPARERRANVRGAFRPGRPVTGRVLLVDDVITTANTVGEAARLLTANPDTEVVVYALARA